MMETDATIAIERVQSESLGALLSIHAYGELDEGYFTRLRTAVEQAVRFFAEEQKAPPTLIKELESTAQVLRNEASAFPGRTIACNEMAKWLTAQSVALAAPRAK